MPALVVVAVALATGTFAGALPGGAPWLTMVLAGATYVAAALASRSTVSWLVLFAAVAIAGAGHSRYVDAAERPRSAIATLDGVHRVTGVVRAAPHSNGNVGHIDLSLETVDGHETGGGLRLTVNAGPEPLRAGDRITATGEVQRPPVLDGFDYAAYLDERGIHAVMAYPATWERIGHAGRPWPLAWLDATRDRTVRNIERVLPEPEASLAVGLLVGADRTMPEALGSDLRTTGATHLVVVSGQNIALLLGGAVAILTAVVPRRRAALLALPLVPVYVILVGAEPPVVRAAIMALALTASDVLGRRTPGWVFLAYAAAAMLALEPRLAVSLSFQLSLAATAGVIVVAPPLRDAVLSRLRLTSSGYLATFIEVTTVATGAALATLPVQVIAFGSISAIQVPANIVVAPLYEATLAAALLAVLAGQFDATAASAGPALEAAPGLFVTVVAQLARLPGATATIDQAPAYAGVLWYAALIFAVALFSRARPTVLDPPSRAAPPLTALLAIAAGGLWLAVLAPPDRLASVTVLDVGQGLAILVRDGDNTVLIDAGPADGAVIEALGRVGHRADLDAVVLTHADLDHAGGLAALRRRVPLGRLLTAADSDIDAPDAAEHIDIGDRIRVSDRTTVEVLGPPVESAGQGWGENDRSLVVRVTVGDRRFLLPADIEASAESWLVRSGYALRSDVLVIPHHGSTSSSTDAFVLATAPSVAIASAGASNPHGHPAPGVLTRYASALVRRTDLDGDVTIRTDGERLWVATGGTSRGPRPQRTDSADATVTPQPVGTR